MQCWAQGTWWAPSHNCFPKLCQFVQTVLCPGTALIEQLASSGQRKISIAEANMKKCIVYDSEIAGFAAMGTRQATNHFRLVSVLQAVRRQIRREEEIYMQWTPGHSNHFGNEIADVLAFLGSQGTCFCPNWMKDAFRKVYRKATEIGTVEPKQEFTPMQHAGWSGFRDVFITAAEKVIDRGRQPVVGLRCSEESLREIRRKRRRLDEKVQWVRRVPGVDEIKKRKKELNSIRSKFNAYRWKARKEWANKKVLELQRAEELHDLGAIYRILRETGLSVEKTFSAKGREFCLASTAATHLETRGQDQTADLGDVADRVPNVPTNHKLASGNQIYNMSNEGFGAQHGRDHQNTDCCWWRSRNGYVVADIEVCMLYKRKRPA